jgi:hypothetical protein
VQRVMEIEWMFFKAASMLEYHGIEQDPQAIVRLVEIMARGNSRW